jgi:hypothetical protein
MADSSAVIHMTVGSPITVPMGLDQLRDVISHHDDTPGEPPLFRIQDTQGATYLINANEIVAIEGT